jgi:hypothetical protein
MIRGLANPKAEGARREVHSHPQPCLKCGVIQVRRGGFGDWQLLNQGGAMVDSIARPTLSKLGGMTGVEGR